MTEEGAGSLVSMPHPVNQNIFSKVYATVRRTVLPPRCLVCGEPGHAMRDLCAACAANLRWNVPACPRCALPLATIAPACGQCLRRPPPLDETRAAFVYAPPLDRLLLRFKFHRDLAAGNLLSSLMADTFAGAAMGGALIPLPLHRSRLRSRGYDQALELAVPLARSLRIPLLGDRLIRQRNTVPQSELDAAARRRNLHDAFRVLGTPPKHAILLDDVMTTGTTLHAAARALRRAGAQRVDAWVCARVP